MSRENTSTPKVAIIGAGLGGIAAAVNLTKRGISTFTVFEKSAGAGGTWWDNRYPGAECDVPSALYSYSFKPHDWSRTHATQPEIQQYIDEVVDEYGFRDRMRFERGIERVGWDPDRMQHLITTDRGEDEWFDVVVSAVGMLNVPNVPSWPGMDSFKGPIFHSARWRNDVDLRGKTVAVIGAGASAAQIVPGLQPIAGKVLTFQREPGWVFPKGDKDYTPEERAALNRFGRRRRARRETLRMMDKGLKVATDPVAAEASVKRGTDYIQTIFADRPDLQSLLTPTFAPRCKRNIQSSTFYPALLQPNVELITRSVERVTEDGVVDAQGVEYPVDAIVLTTGFKAQQFLSTYEVIGRDGRSLRETWGQDPHAYLGMTVPGFPNFYIMYGPNTHGTVVSVVLEHQAEFIARDVRRLGRAGGGAIEVKTDVEAQYQEKLQRAIGNVPAWKSGCNNFYETSTGRNVVQWPWSHEEYRRYSARTRRSSSTLSRLSESSRAARLEKTESGTKSPALTKGNR